MSGRKLISPQYAELNRQLHAERPDYGASAGELAEDIAVVAKNHDYRTVLDFGCGKGTLKKALKRIAPRLRVIEFDPAIENKDRLPSVSPDLITALDVMEHIEPEYLDNVLEAMCDLKPKAVYMMISLVSAQKTLPDGRNTHLIIESADWWVERLKRFFRIEFQERDEAHLLFVGSPIS